ncbi:LacI family DNA-binding transcriptional regulator [Streptantibioticus rubrisoli]|uniref:LacI family transcriptional regulator n=1 Tax=Streptantibioticus rubrisoli TaxID=1387313 RepID=A0ABT1PBL4_9ACTN|nr:LacI family DNA-binding transcriptional regulator [Streptantibioticus rubrisoli]MCQ4041623.1 LacI family transcriptional regulator [Streptantibioticus rubrisoli]
MRRSARRPTIKDIARRAGVSQSAVSFALNDRPGVSPATRERVRRVAEQLGWQPSTAARALSGEGAATVGLVLARPARTLGVESFFLRLVSGVQEALAERRLGLLFQVVEDVAAECEVYRRWWAEHRVDGLLVVDPRHADARPGLLDSLGLPAVIIGGLESGSADGAAEYPAISELRTDDAGAMASIVDHLYQLGHRRIAHIAGLPELAHTRRRTHSLREAAGALGLTEVRSVSTDYSDAQGAAATRAVLDDARPPTAIVYDNDVMAVAGLAVATERGLAVPGDLAIVAWDDSVLCRSTHPGLTALVRDTGAFGRRAATALLALLDGEPAVHVLDERPRLTPRGSTVPLAASRQAHGKALGS